MAGEDFGDGRERFNEFGDWDESFIFPWCESQVTNTTVGLVAALKA